MHELLAENGLSQFYELQPHPGTRVAGDSAPEKWAFLDDRGVQQRLLDFSDGQLNRVRFQLPAIHCVACVWLLENLFRLHPGIIRSQVNFPRREVAIYFASGKISLSQLAALLASIGYEPQLTLGEVEKAPTNPARKRLWLQIGVAGFAFGNVMLFSLPHYLGLDAFSEPLLKSIFGWLSLALAAPVLVYSAGDYWHSAWLSFRQRMLTLDVPIALGLAALYLQSTVAILFGWGEAYLDSLCGLVFFLLCGRAFQEKTYERLAFDRDYKCFFPLSVMRRSGSSDATVAISSLQVGDRLLLRNGEIIPADCRLMNGSACIDYSFVTGESEQVRREPGDYLYAGGKQMGMTIEVETLKAVSQSYLASLWNHSAFRKPRLSRLETLTNRYSRRFTKLVIAIALVAGLVWAFCGKPAKGVKAVTSVLIVACPCALALTAPFALGTAQRLLARRQVFVRNGQVLERMAQVDAIVFDKTGTLSTPGADGTQFVGEPLSSAEAAWVEVLARHSIHPHARAVRDALAKTALNQEMPANERLEWFKEESGCGISGVVDGHELRLGSQPWLEQGGVRIPAKQTAVGSGSCLAIDGGFRGWFSLAQGLRPEINGLLRRLGRDCELALLSGDNERERLRFERVFGAGSRLYFNQTPVDKLQFVQDLQGRGKVVMMVGDGLNDAGALKQSDVGIAVVEDMAKFSPASDVILAVEQVPNLSKVLALTRHAVKIVRLSFGISAIYNAVGIGVAAAGILSPVICAILMPLSSISVVLFACGATTWAARSFEAENA